MFWKNEALSLIWIQIPFGGEEHQYKNHNKKGHTSLQVKWLAKYLKLLKDANHAGDLIYFS